MASSGRELKVRFQEPSIVIQRKENDARNQAQEANAHLQALRLTSKRLALSLSSSLNGVHQTLKEIKADVKVGSRELIHRNKTTTFKCFARLPFEIKELIWEFAMPNRLITFAHPPSKWTLNRRLSLLPHPQTIPFGHNGIKQAQASFALLRVCYEARLVALRHLHRTNTVRHPLQPEDPTPRPTQFRRAAPGTDFRRPSHHDPFNLDADAVLMPIRDTARGRSFRDPRVRHLLNTRHLVVAITEKPRKLQWEEAGRGTWRRRLAPCLPDAPCPHPATWGAPVSFEDTRVPEDDHLLGHFADLETVTYVFRPYRLRRARRRQPAPVVGPRAYVVYARDPTAGYADQLRELYGSEGPVRTARVWNGVLPDCLEGDRVHPTALVRIGRVVDPDEWKETLSEAAWTAARLVWLVLVRMPVFVLLSPFVSGSAAWDVCFVSGWLGELI
ncbi:hypothetical protein HYQ45_018619 [Verticillium longisporum]|uniref:2EXR domain-containing protein n=1 Tax=Verticillium longisporum TaxID=100787 RepID=A0A8I2Z4D1_VERLO|nr:hypothetical protein HYQ45_018619 [Verticillium longisporum]RBQ85339.1 hypothetical protein VDGD_01267 [Verticillium dahliae]